MSNSVYALAFGAHPDDVEICCSATLVKIIQEGNTVAVCDLSRGELGTRGTATTRKKEAIHAAKIMNYQERITLNLGDGNIEYSQKNILEVIKIIRHFKPIVVLVNPPTERHPDHAKSSRLVTDACFYAGLDKIKTTTNGSKQTLHRPIHILYYLHDRFTTPDIIIDVSDTFEESRKAILAFQSQFYNPTSNEKETYISRKEFLSSLEDRARLLGERISKKYGEGFLLQRTLGISHVSSVFQ